MVTTDRIERHHHVISLVPADCQGFRGARGLDLEFMALESRRVGVGGDPDGSGVCARFLGDCVFFLLFFPVEEVTLQFFGRLRVRKTVEAVEDAFSQVDQCIFEDADLSSLVNLDATGVHDSEILEVEVSILDENAELREPESLLSQDRVMVTLTFTDTENTVGSFNLDLDAIY